MPNLGQNAATVISCIATAVGGGFGVAILNGWISSLKDKEKQHREDADEAINLRLQNVRLKFDLQRQIDYQNEIDLLAMKTIDNWRAGKDLSASFDMLDVRIHARPRIQHIALPGDGDENGEKVD